MSVDKTESLIVSAKECFKPYQERIDMLFEKDIVERYGAGEVIDACRYVFCSGGKKLRPSIVYSIAQALDPDVDVDKIALAIELFQVVTLVVDDLPCMDNDDMRRGKPSLHKAFSEKMAIFVSYSLVAHAYSLIQEAPTPRGKEAYCVLKEAIAHASSVMGYPGVVLGGYVDMCDREYTEDEIHVLVDRKTGALLELAFVFGWLYGGGDIEKLERVKEMAKYFGRAFQYADDIDDEEQDRRVGNKANFVLAFGIDATRAMVRSCMERFLDIARELGVEKTPIARFAKAAGEVVGLGA